MTSPGRSARISGFLLSDSTEQGHEDRLGNSLRSSPSGLCAPLDSLKDAGVKNLRIWLVAIGVVSAFLVITCVFYVRQAFRSDTLVIWTGSTSFGLSSSAGQLWFWFENEKSEYFTPNRLYRKCIQNESLVIATKKRDWLSPDWSWWFHIGRSEKEGERTGRLSLPMWFICAGFAAAAGSATFIFRQKLRGGRGSSGKTQNLTSR